jgi:hypothetical protein
MENNILFNSHYVPLNPPYPILYLRGRVGIQTGSLLVVQPQLRGSNVPGALRMVSMPVVNYVNKSKQLPSQLTMYEHRAENVVWQVDISGTELLGYDNTETIHIETFCGIERLRNMSGMSYGFSLARLVQDIKSLGFKISPEFYPQNPHGSLELMYGHLDANTTCLTANHIKNIGGGMMIAVKVSSSMDDVFARISEQVDDYKRAVERKDITVEFRCKEPQFGELIKLLNVKYGAQQ